MVCASHPNHIKILQDHNGALIVRNGALMDLQQVFQVAYLTTILSNQFFLESLD
jgi:hypothetical protein